MSCEQLKEEWRPVVGHEGWYSISSLGRLRRDALGRGVKRPHLLMGSTHREGYKMVRLCAGRTNVRPCKIHQLVAEAFLGPRPVGHEVNHKNGIPGDNRVENLEYLTHRDNVRHTIYVLRRPWAARGSRVGSARLSETEVKTIRLLYAQQFLSQSEIGERFCVTQSTISKIVLGRSWQHLLAS